MLFKELPANEQARVISFAKELYLTPANNGHHAYAESRIAQLVESTFGITICNDSVHKWINKYHWTKIWMEGYTRGLTKAIAQRAHRLDADTRSNEEALKELLATKEQSDYEVADELKDLAIKYIKEHGFASTSEALKALELGLKYTRGASDLLDTSLKDVVNRIADAVRSVTLDDDVVDDGT